MATATLQVSDRFTPGTTLSVYTNNLAEAQAGQAPVGSAVTTTTVDSNGTAVVSGLNVATEYVAGAQVSGKWRYVGFMVPPLATDNAFAGLADVDPGALTDGYTLGFSGGKVIGKRASGWFDASSYAGGINGAAGQIAQAIADATAAITSTRGATAYIPAGLWDCAGGGSITGAVAAIPRALPAGLRILFDTGAIVRLSSNIPRLFDFNKIADYDTFQHVLIDGNGMTVDANNVGGKHHVVIGTYRAASRQTRINVKDVTVRGVNAVNVLRDPTITNHRLGFWIEVNHPASGETQTTLTNIAYRDCTCMGGNAGFAVNGNGTGAINVFVDDVKYENCVYDSGATPTGFFASSGFQVASAGFGNRCRLVNCHAYNAGDNGFEIDSMADVTLEDCSGTDCVTCNFLMINARQVSYGGPERQVATLRNCRGYRLNFGGNGGAGRAFQVSGTAYEYGRIMLDGCHSYFTQATAAWSEAGSGFWASSALIRELIIRDFHYEQTGIAHTNSSDSDPSAIYLDLDSPRARLVLNGRVHVAGNRGGTGTVRWRGATINGTDLRIDVDLYVDMDVTNMVAGNTRGLMFGDTASTLRGKASLKIERWTSDSTARPIWIGSPLVVTDRLTIEYSDFTQLVALAGNDVFFSDTDQATKIFYGPGNRWRGGAPAPVVVSVGASPFVYQNTTGNRQDVYLKGGTVSLVERSRTGAFAGEQFDVGAVAGHVASLDNGDSVRVTYTAVPTMTRIGVA